LGVASIVACVACLLPQVPFTTQALQWPANINNTLKTIPTGSVVLAYPFPTESFVAAMSWQAADDMRFRLFGGYVLVQGPHNYGIPNQPLLNHPFVQEYLANAQFGAAILYPEPNPKVSAPHALCRFVSRYNVGAVVFWDKGAQPQEVKRLFIKDFGPPQRSTRSGKILVWLTSAHNCAS
jgi:hypothetical protein